jgi:hypothetical protein
MDPIPAGDHGDSGDHGLIVICLYCGCPDDIYEQLNVIGERTSEYVLHCGLCNGAWTQ